MNTTASTCLILAVLLLSGCKTTDSIIQEHGQPDMIFESAGDIGRHYLADRPVACEWRWDCKTLYYIDEDQAFVFRDSYLDETRAINLDERQIYEDMLQSPD